MLAAIVLFLNFIDANFTMVMIKHPVWGNIPEEMMEMNPLWQTVIERFGLTTFMIAKTFLVLALVGIVLLAKKGFARVSMSFIAGYYVNLVLIQYAHIVMFSQQIH